MRPKPKADTTWERKFTEKNFYHKMTGKWGLEIRDREARP